MLYCRSSIVDYQLYLTIFSPYLRAVRLQNSPYFCVFNYARYATLNRFWEKLTVLQSTEPYKKWETLGTNRRTLRTDRVTVLTLKKKIVDCSTHGQYVARIYPFLFSAAWYFHSNFLKHVYVTISYRLFSNSLIIHKENTKEINV